MAISNLLTEEQITFAKTTLIDNKLKPTQIEDLLSIFREFLGYLAENYQIEKTLTDCQDVNGSEKCAKLSACLMLWQDNQFSNGGFAPTLANRTGFNFSIDVEDYRIFKYAFGLFWNVPQELENKFIKNGRGRVSETGSFINTY